MTDVCAAVRQILTERFSEGELRTLAADLGLDLDDLPGEAKPDKARELVDWFSRRRQLGRLIAGIEAARPDVELPDGVVIGCERVRIRRRTVMEPSAGRTSTGIERQVERLAEGMDNVKSELGQLRTDVRLLQADMLTVKAQVREIDEYVRTGAPMSRQVTLTVLFGITSIVMAAAVIFMAVWR